MSLTRPTMLHTSEAQSANFMIYMLCCNHYGSMGSGHYTADIKLQDENKWYNFDDSHISPMNEDVRCSSIGGLRWRMVLQAMEVSHVNRKRNLCRR